MRSCKRLATPSLRACCFCHAHTCVHAFDLAADTDAAAAVRQKCPPATLLEPNFAQRIGVRFSLAATTGIQISINSFSTEVVLLLIQNPKERITLNKMMKHSWVTRRGSWPLRSVKEMIRVGERPELPPVLPDLMSTLNVLDIPRQVCTLLISFSLPW